MHDMKTKKELRAEFKLHKFRAGIFQIVNKENNKIYLQSTSDIDRAFNSDIFQLKAGMHSNKSLQHDWDQFGSDVFECNILDELTSKDTATPEEINKDLKELLEIHQNEMKSSGQLLY